METILTGHTAVQLDLFSGHPVTGSPAPMQEDNEETLVAIDDIENFFYSRDFIDCCARCELRGLCDKDECAQILD